MSIKTDQLIQTTAQKLADLRAENECLRAALDRIINEWHWEYHAAVDIARAALEKKENSHE
jgi:hypothetical protein